MAFVYMFDIHTAYAKAVVPSMGEYFVVVNFLAASLHLGLWILSFGLPTDSCGGFSKAFHPSWAHFCYLMTNIFSYEGLFSLQQIEVFRV